VKTKELRNLYIRLSELNNSFTHYSFVWNQFNIDYFETIKANPDELTKDYFDSNPYKRKHNIKLKDLFNEHSKTDTTLIQGIFLLIYSHFEGYLKSVFQFSQKIDETIETFESKIDDVELDSILLDKVFNRLSIDKNKLDSQLIDTLDYFRLKRNRLIHQNSESISKTLNQIIKSKGEQLNKFWDSILPSHRQGIDFSDKLVANNLNFSIVIDTLNIFRKVAADIDSCIIDKLTVIKIAEKHIIPEFVDEQYKKIKHLKIERKVSKFIRYCDTEFSLVTSDEIIKLLKSSIA